MTAPTAEEVSRGFLYRFVTMGAEDGSRCVILFEGNPDGYIAISPCVRRVGEKQGTESCKGA